MEPSLSELYDQLKPDPWRKKNGFSKDFSSWNSDLLVAADDAERARILGAWLERFQPCLFGRVAAKKDLISYCFLTEDEIQQSDSFVSEKIQRVRTEWTKLGFEGRKSAFVLVAVSPRLAVAEPNEQLLAFAQKLGWLYLREEMRPNTIYMDEIFLEMPGAGRVTWRWNVGANFFGAGGDGRWWHDHRIPGGVGYSMNSVGHLVKSGVIAGRMEELAGLLGAPTEGLTQTKVDSLPTALEWAMLTISKAHATESGTATELLPLPGNSMELPVSPCPVALPTYLQDRNYCEYQGYYHTDHTLPGEYFSPDVLRPPAQQPRRLDFTYLFHDDVSNPDFQTTGSGRRVRSLEPLIANSAKTTRAVGSTGLISSFPRLVEALASVVK
jgi:hypothetical protein